MYILIIFFYSPVLFETLSLGLISPSKVQWNVRLEASVSWKNAFYDFIHNWIVTDFRIQAGEASL